MWPRLIYPVSHDTTMYYCWSLFSVWFSAFNCHKIHGCLYLFGANLIISIVILLFFNGRHPHPLFVICHCLVFSFLSNFHYQAHQWLVEQQPVTYVSPTNQQATVVNCLDNSSTLLGLLATEYLQTTKLSNNHSENTMKQKLLVCCLCLKTFKFIVAVPFISLSLLTTSE